MHKFYVPELTGDETLVSLKEEDVNHIKNVLRMRIGEQILVCNGQGINFCCSITDISSRDISVKVDCRYEAKSELPIQLTLFQGLPKKDKMELIVQKAVELGVYRIVPVITRRTIVKLEEAKKEARKTERWNMIAESAAKQSKRDIIPEVTSPVGFKEALRMAGELEANIIPYEETRGIEAARATINELCSKKSAGIFIGPEGGFDIEEIEAAKAVGIEPVTLGNRILRTETAGLAVLSVIMFNTDKDNKQN